MHLETLGPEKVYDSNGDLKFERRYKDLPSEVFLALTPTAQAYYLPAFLQGCERDPKRSHDILPVLAEQLTRSSNDAELLRKQLTPKQKEVIVAYFENWCTHDVSGSMIKKLHRVLTND